MAATRSRMPRQAEYARRSTVRNGCLERAKGSAKEPPLTLSPINRPPRRRTPQRGPLPSRGRGSRHGRRPGPLRTLRHKNHPNIRPPSLPSRRRGPISSGNPPLPLSRPPKVGGRLCGNRAGSRPGIEHSNATSWNLYPPPRVTADLLRPTKLGGAAALHRAHPPHQERLRAGRLKDIPFRGRVCPRQREPRDICAAQ